MFFATGQWAPTIYDNPVVVVREGGQSPRGQKKPRAIIGRTGPSIREKIYWL
jgi:hypothetical protein